jgi:hypothetical protein
MVSQPKREIHSPRLSLRLTRVLALAYFTRSKSAGDCFGYALTVAYSKMEVLMGLLKIEGVTHWSIPVNDLAESEKFYGDLLGLKPLGRLGNSGMSCFNVGKHNILLYERAETG